MNNEQFSKQIEMVIKGATFAQINKAVKMLPAEQGNMLMLAWQMHHNPPLAKMVNEMVAAKLK